MKWILFTLLPLICLQTAQADQVFTAKLPIVHADSESPTNSGSTIAFRAKLAKILEKNELDRAEHADAASGVSHSAVSK